jgi:tRNA modification GTPase
MGSADLVLLCAEAGRRLGEDESTIMLERPTLLVRTKIDLASAGGEELGVSTVTGEGLAELRRTAAKRVFGGQVNLADLEPALTRERHRTALHQAHAALAQAVPHLGRGGDAVLAAHHVREATTALEELLGAVDVDEILDRVFASFCVGK